MFFVSNSKKHMDLISFGFNSSIQEKEPKMRFLFYI